MFSQKPNTRHDEVFVFVIYWFKIIHPSIQAVYFKTSTRNFWPNYPLKQAAFFFVSLYPNYEEGSEPQRNAATLLHNFSQFLYFEKNFSHGLQDSGKPEI